MSIVKFGYPPKLLTIDTTTAKSTLDSLGIKDGEQILISERPDGSVATYNFASDFSTPITTSTPAVAPAQTAAPSSATPSLATMSNSAASSAFAASTGAGSGGSLFGSHPTHSTTGAQSAFQARSQPGNAFGGLATAGSSFNRPVAPPPLPQRALSESTNAVRIRDQGLLVVREVEDDNSCLFNAIAYTLDPTMKNNVRGLRQIVAQAIEANSDAYPDVVLGRPRKEYCDWIMRENSWGGAIELAIFSDYYKTGRSYGIIGERRQPAMTLWHQQSGHCIFFSEIDSIDVSTNRVDRFGEGQYGQRVLVMYSGIHYDAIALTPGLDIPAECDQTQFDTHSEDIISAGVQLAAKLKQAHKYTDLATFTLRCSICQVGLKGEKDAQQHAQQTMHTSFEEYH
ncbi:hypothetical protein BGZ99_003205 [Dissophora globulifera]|uniref:Ubiquitin thioesterase OTU n=1 Tax=Dissophora globulifera TaxID=979702 RepID=A0A9P6RQR3_9FUNG|nr:hypothetical protein BGZ99_003205 [Dissophora globulifera]